MIELAKDVDGEASALIDIIDHLAPLLDAYEQALYLYVFRHTHLIGRSETTIGFKSASKRMAFGVGAKGTRIAEGTIYEKLRSLNAKGCLDVLDVARSGTRVRLHLPAHIPGVICPQPIVDKAPIETLDFFADPARRTAIFERDGWRCFYCLKHLHSSNAVLEHVVSRPAGDNSYRNLVASCARCNNRKGFDAADVYLRRLFREGFLSDEELTGQLLLLNQTRLGERRPNID